ncbi:alpha/beta hydrolase family protein [Tundrisphaera lichenicola]|uniref:alpha/beta hydrolase family protein n=1 Tax=Tundrisphaera lichenicola TaxID=2029860 RepID=UPI003EB70B29
MHRSSAIFFLLLGGLVGADRTLVEESRADDRGSPAVLILPGERLTVDGHPGFLFLPPEGKRTSPQPWVMYAPTLAGYPDSHEKWMHERFLEAGIAVAGVDVGEAYGSPKGREGLTALYRELTEKRGFARRPVLLGRSRGGLWVTSWAAENPEKVAGIAGIYPVFDLRTYPGLDKAAPAYGLSEAALKEKLDDLNPINRVGVLARGEIPVFIIHGDDDKVVPLPDNSAALVKRYQEAGKSDSVTLIVAKGQGHNFWEGFFRCQPLVDFVITKAKQAR